ncbi:DUF7003 family protein [Micromonospora sp. SL1-18]|uniref:DUF7003 family protein n=1 Tax=Micromonospora sp. SL1-18 TaxID=3399128 RepID=UPI003A4E5616
MSTGQTQQISDILEQLDGAQEEYSLLGPGNANYPSAGTRMDAFHSPSNWLLTIQLVAYGRGEDDIVRIVQAFGSDVPEPGALFFGSPITSEGGGSLPSDDLPLSDHHCLILNGRVKEIQLLAEDYAAAGIDEAATPAALALARVLIAKYPEDVFLKPDEILREIGKSGYESLFTLDEWQHPDPAEDELPSEIDCFQDIARTIHKKETAHLPSCQSGNTHWSHWTEYE